MKRFLGILFGLAAMVASASAAPAQAPMNDVHKVSFPFMDAVVVGTKTLPAGQYKLECRMIDGQEVMIFKSEKGVEITRVPCKPVDVAAPVKISQYTLAKKDGALVLTSVQIKGERITHVLTPAS